MPNDNIKEFVVQLLIHLDILIIPKTKQKSIVNHAYLVPCMIKDIKPKDFVSFDGSKKKNTICMRYKYIDRNSIPTALAFKVIGATLNAWPLKDERKHSCLYHKAALLNVNEDIELRIWIENNRIIVYMTHEKSLLSISPDVAASVQECLTKNLDSSLLFHYNSFGRKMKPSKVSELYEMEFGIPCGSGVCYVPSQEVLKIEKWECKNKKAHDTRYLRNWVFNKDQETCGPECKGLTDNELKTEPGDKHLVRLGSQIGIKSFEEFFINLGMKRKDWESTEYTYAGHSPEGIMSMALKQWKKLKISKLENPTLQNLSDALTAINLDGHVICQVFREETNLLDIANFKLQETPSNKVLEELSHQIGNCALQLGIELGLSYCAVEESFVKFPKDLSGLIEDILLKWKANSKMKTIHSLMMALQRVNGGGVQYLLNLAM